MNEYNRFRPSLPKGCVAHDRRMAQALAGCYRWELYAVAAYLQRSVACEGEDGRLSVFFDELAHEEIEHFRTVGELIAALGERPILRAQVCVRTGGSDREGDGGRLRMLRESVREEHRMIGYYQNLMKATEDRVVRSLLMHFLSDGHRHIQDLERMEKSFIR